MSDNESENEDHPRLVADPLAEYTMKDDPSAPFKLQNFNPMVETLDGEMIPFPGVLAVRPIPAAEAVAHAKSSMGDGHNGVWTATPFVPSADTAPDFLFPNRFINTNSSYTRQRFCIRRRFVPAISHLKTMMIYTDGACPNNGSPSARGTYGFVFNSTPGGKSAGVLERQGPDGQVYPPTNNRAELRAVLAALGFRGWWGEGWRRIVIVTDSEYVGLGATTWMRKWAGNDWRTAGGKKAANRDLWEALSAAMGEYAAGGCEISFWIVPRAQNTLADAAATDTTLLGNRPIEEKYSNVFGVLV
ncbi:ribonuclease H-like domain-containing protein [Mycena filopes]|nr:ribonuclease H-like domain-containing protein [Mycena filopes]